MSAKANLNEALDCRHLLESAHSHNNSNYSTCKEKTKGLGLEEERRTMCLCTEAVNKLLSVHILQR